eukprot:10643949-Alexandrium_andersonii.AAC.1
MAKRGVELLGKHDGFWRVVDASVAQYVRFCMLTRDMMLRILQAVIKATSDPLYKARQRTLAS